MYPRALLAHVCYLHHIGVDPGCGSRLSECSFVHTGRAGADNNTRQSVFMNGILYHILTCLRTHVLIVFGNYNARLIP